MSKTPTVIYSARNVQEAALLQAQLAEENIESQLANQVLEGGAGTDILGWPSSARVVVHEEYALRAREIALEFERRLAAGPQPSADEMPAVTATTDSHPWPICPKCGAQRLTACPVCGTSGTQFPQADMPLEVNRPAGASEGSPDSAASGLGDLLPAAGAAGPSCGPCGCTAGQAAGDRTPTAGADASAEASQAADRPMLICPTCDEPFVPQYLRWCEWCGHEFPDGIELPPAPEPGEGLNGRLLLMALALAVVLVAIVLYLAFLFPTPQ